MMFDKRKARGRTARRGEDEMISVTTKAVTLDETSLARIAGFACNRAWAHICFFSITLFHMPDAMGGSINTNVYLWSVGALALTLTVAALLHERTERMLSGNVGMVIGPLVMSAGSALIPAAGLPEVAQGAQGGLMAVAALFTGAGSAMLLMSWSIAFSKLKLNRLVVESCSAYFFGILLYTLISLTPPVAQYAFAIALPLMSAWLCRNADAAAVSTLYQKPHFESQNRDFLKVAAGIVLFGFVAGITRDIQPVTQNQPSDGFALTMLIAMSLIIIAFVVITGKRQALDINMLFRPALIVMIAGILLIPLFGQSSLVPAALVKTGYTCFELIVWIILGYLCQRMKLSPVLTFGFGRSLIAASGFVGSIAAYALAPVVLQNPMRTVAFSTVLVLALLILCNSILTTENFSKLWKGREDAKRASFKDRCETLFDQYELSPRQREIAYLIACGRDANYISEKLFISKGTINAHRLRIYKKLDIHSRQDLLDMIPRAHRDDGERQGDDGTAPS